MRKFLEVLRLQLCPNLSYKISESGKYHVTKRFWRMTTEQASVKRKKLEVVSFLNINYAAVWNTHCNKLNCMFKVTQSSMYSRGFQLLWFGWFSQKGDLRMLYATVKTVFSVPPISSTKVYKLTERCNTVIIQVENTNVLREELSRSKLKQTA